MSAPRSLTACFAIILLALSGPGAWSQATRTIKVILPVAPGGGMDFLARVLAEQIGRAQSVTIVVESRPGAGSAIGTEAASRASPDGSTLLINAAGNLLIGPHLRKLNYDPLTSFEPICELVSIPNIIVVNSASPYRTLADLLGAARAKPGDLTMASIGPATDTHVAFQELRRAANVDMSFVPYPGVAPAVIAVLGGHVTSAIVSYAAAAEQFKVGALRALATTASTRFEALPSVPTVAESGYDKYEMDVWFGLFAPAKTPRETISRLSDWFASAVQSPEIRPKLVAQGLYPVGTCGADFAALVRKQYEDFGRVIRESNMKAE